MIIKYTEQDKKRLNELSQNFWNLREQAELNFTKAEPGTPDYIKAQKERLALFDEHHKELLKLYNKIEREHFAKLGNDLETILEDAEKQVDLIINTHIESVDKTAKKPYVLSVESALKLLKKELKRHLKALYRNAYHENLLNEYIYNYCDSHQRIEPITEDNKIFFPFIEHYITKKDAIMDGDLTELPDRIAIATREGYEYGVSLYQEGNAYLDKIDPSKMDGLIFDDGKIFFQNMQEVSKAELQDMRTGQDITNIDLPLLKMFFSILLSENTKNNKLQNITTIYLPDFAEHIGLGRNLNKKDIDTIIKKTQSFHSIVGIINHTKGGRQKQSIYPILNFEGYNAKNNTISFGSPYFNNLINTLIEKSIKRDKNGKEIQDKSGQVKHLPYVSYVIHSSITSEQNIVAVENVSIIVKVIEQAGTHTPHIKASTILERNPQLKARVESSSNPTQLLKRAFKKTFELLRTHTDLERLYKSIELPDPNDPSNIPTMKTLNTLVYTFRHQGKIKTQNDVEENF